MSPVRTLLPLVFLVALGCTPSRGEKVAQRMQVLQALSAQAKEPLQRLQSFYYKLTEESPDPTTQVKICSDLLPFSSQVYQFDPRPVVEDLASKGVSRELLDPLIPPIQEMTRAARVLTRYGKRCYDESNPECVADCVSAFQALADEVDQLREVFRDELSETDAKLPRLKLR